MYLLIFLLYSMKYLIFFMCIKCIVLRSKDFGFTTYYLFMLWTIIIIALKYGKKKKSTV